MDVLHDIGDKKASDRNQVCVIQMFLAAGEKNYPRKYTILFFNHKKKSKKIFF